MFFNRWLYLRHIASINSPLFSTKPNSSNGSVVNQDDDPFLQSISSRHWWSWQLFCFINCTDTLYRYLVQIPCTDTLYRYLVQIPCTDTLYRYLVQIPCTDTLYRYLVPIPCTDTLYRYLVQIPCTDTLYRYLVPIPCTDTLYRYLVQIPCTDTLYRYLVQIPCTDTLYRYLVQIPCTDTLYRYLVQIPCTDTLYRYLVQIPCTDTLYRYLVPILLILYQFLVQIPTYMSHDIPCTNTVSQFLVPIHQCCGDDLLEEQHLPESFEASLDDFLMTLPDTPPTPGYVAANNNTNSLLDWTETNGRTLPEVPSWGLSSNQSKVSKVFSLCSTTTSTQNPTASSG